MRIFIAAILLLAISLPADAFDPQPGSRAYPLRGRDLVSGETIDLDDHLGKWVLLCFWSTW